MRQKQPQNKREIFNVNIRKNARNKIMGDLRLRLNYDCPPINQLAQQLGLQPKQQPYSLTQIIIERWEFLVNPSIWLINYSQDMNQQKTEQKNSQLCLVNTDFWSYFVKELYEEALKPTLETYTFLIQFMNTNKYQTLAKEKNLERKVINALQLAAYFPNTPIQFKQTAIQWVQGTQGLILLSNAALNQFLNINQYKNFYMVIDRGFDLVNRQLLDTCCQLLIFNFKFADSDQCYQFYQQFSTIMPKILYKASALVQTEDVSIFGSASIAIASSYNSVVLDYARLGLALLGARMIKSNNDENLSKGLQIINFCSEVESKDLIQFLVKDPQLKDQMLWQNILLSQRIFSHRKIDIRKFGYSIIANIFNNGYFDQILQLINILQQNNKDLFQFLRTSLQLNQDTQIIRNCLSIISILIYYGSVKKEEQQDPNIPMQNILEKGIDKIIQKFVSHDNEKIHEGAVVLMQSINHEIQKSQSIN